MPLRYRLHASVSCDFARERGPVGAAWAKELGEMDEATSLVERVISHCRNERFTGVLRIRAREGEGDEVVPLAVEGHEIYAALTRHGGDAKANVRFPIPDSQGEFGLTPDRRGHEVEGGRVKVLLP